MIDLSLTWYSVITFPSPVEKYLLRHQYWLQPKLRWPSELSLL